MDDWNNDPPSGLSSEEPSTLAADALPEVLELRERGWVPAPEAPLFAFLPAVWPAEHRTWVQDRSTHFSVEFVDQEPGRLVRASAESTAAYDNDMAGVCEQAGVPTRPARRLWFLRVPPTAEVSLDDVLGLIKQRAKANGTPVRPSPAFTRAAVDTLAEVFTRP